MLYSLYNRFVLCSITGIGNWSSADSELQRYPLLTEMYIEEIPLQRGGTKRSNAIVLTPSRGRHLAGSFRCQRCGNFYTYKKNLLRHLNLECGKEPQFQCPYCPKKAKHKNHMLRHIRSQHIGNVWMLYKELWAQLIGCFSVVQIDWLLVKWLYYAVSIVVLYFCSDYVSIYVWYNLNVSHSLFVILDIQTVIHA